MAAALATHRAVVVVLEACLEASSVEDHRTTSPITATTATPVPRQAAPTPAPPRQRPTTPALKAANTAAALQAMATHLQVLDNNTVRVKPTEATADNTLRPSSNSTANTASIKATARKLDSVNSQDTVGQHQAMVKDHRQAAHQAATDNKLATEVRHTAHQPVPTAAPQTTITTSTTSTAVLPRTPTNMAAVNSILLLLVAIRLGTEARRATTLLSRVGSKSIALDRPNRCAVLG